MKMSNKVYDILSWIGKYILPPAAMLMGSLGNTWNIPYKDEIVLTITAINTFLNSALGISTVNYYKTQVESFNTPDYNAEDNG